MEDGRLLAWLRQGTCCRHWGVLLHGIDLVETRTNCHIRNLVKVFLTRRMRISGSHLLLPVGVSVTRAISVTCRQVAAADRVLGSLSALLLLPVNARV